MSASARAAGHRRGRLRSLLALVGAATLAATIAGCGALSGSDGPTDPPGTGSADGSLEETSLQIGVLPILDTAALHHAQSAGYFTDEGLSVELVTVQGGSAALPQVISGDLDATWSNWTAFFQAQAEGAEDFRLINAGYEAGPNTFVLQVKPGGPVRTAQDLAGKRIAVNAFRNIAELITRSALETDGVDSNSVEFVSLPFPEMGAALQNDQVDAALVPEPFITQNASTLGAVAVLDAASGPTADMPIAGVGLTSRFAEENPNTVAALQRALARAQTDMANRTVVEQVIPTYTQIDPRTASLINLGTWPTTLNATRLQRVADLMREYGVLTQDLDVAPMILESSS